MKIFFFVKLLGYGAFDVVNLMQHRISNKRYAVKIIKKTDAKTNAKTLNEIELGMKLVSQHICKVHKYHEDDEHFYIFMEYLEGMDLCDFIRKDPKFFMNNPNFFWFVLESILRGLVYLHSQGIAHMDIKPENVFLLLDNQGNIIGVKLIDLGLSIVLNDAIKCFSSGTAPYMAPEFFHICLPTGLPADIWSLGITAFAMIRASLPIQIVSRRKDPKQQQEKIHKNIESLLNVVSFDPFRTKSNDLDKDPKIAQMEAFVRLCLITNPTIRPTADDLLKKIPATTSQMSP